MPTHTLHRAPPAIANTILPPSVTITKVSEKLQAFLIVSGRVSV